MGGFEAPSVQAQNMGRKGNTDYRLVVSFYYNYG